MARVADRVRATGSPGPAKFGQNATHRRMIDETDPTHMTDEELAVAIQRHRRSALRGSGYIGGRDNELERELRRRAGIVSEYGAPLRFAQPSRKRRWWWFW